jgi:HlyD family secretion protein
MSRPLDIGAIGSNTPLQLAPFPGPATTPKTKAGARCWRVVAIAMLVLLATFAAAWWTLSGNTTIRYATAPVTIGPIAHTVTATGTVNPELTIIVGTYVSGVIQQLSCDYNMQVKRGQSCAKIDPRPYQTVVDQARLGPRRMPIAAP